MDNAARALIMAASIILGVLLLSTLVYVFRAGASLDEAYDAAQNVRQLGLFNAKLGEYNRNDNTIADMISLANRVYNINADYNFDAKMSVKLVIKIGTSCFVIPDVEPIEDFNRNQIFKGNEDGSVTGKPISIYDLVDLPLKDLEIGGIGNNEDKLSLTKLGPAKYINDNGEEKIKNNSTIYKYIFECVDIQHNAETGRTRSLKFNAIINPDY